MIGHGANSIWSAWIVETWICAGVVATRFTRGAVFVRVARINTTIVQANVTQKAIVVNATSYCGTRKIGID